MKFILLIVLFFIITLESDAQSPEWTSFFSGAEEQNETITDVAFDDNGNTYLLGYGNFATGQSIDFFTVKCNPAGVEEWSRMFNGPQSDNDIPYAIFVDDSGNVYVTGESRWTSTEVKIVTLKYSPEGNLLWKTAFDSLGQSSGEPNDIWVDDNGNVYVAGSLSPTNNGDYDFVTIKMDVNGNILDWAYFGQGTNTSDYGTNIIADNNGNVYTAGDSFRNVTTAREIVLIKYNGNLDTSWVVHINGINNSSNEFAVDLALDDTGNVYILCRLQNTPGGTDLGTLKINSEGDIVWRNVFDEAGGQDIPEAMVLDEDGNVFITGRVRRATGNGYNDFGIVKYNNAGNQQWVSYYDGPQNLDDDPIDINLDQNGNIFVCGESNRDGFFFKFIVTKYLPNGVFNWEYVYDAEVNSKALNLRTDNLGFVYAAGEAEVPAGDVDLFAVKLSQTTGLEDEMEDELIPAKYLLSQNFPNPFNPVTTIQYSIPKSSQVTLKIFNTLGEELETLVNEEKSAGTYELNWNAANLSSGVYFYQLKAGEFVLTRKMILLK